MPMADKDIKQLFELDGAVIRWREIPVAGLPALFLRAAQKHNQKAGSLVQFWNGSGNSKMVTVAGVAVTADRILKVLGAKAEREARRAEGAKRATGGEVAGTAAQPQIPSPKPWSDPLDPKPAAGTPEWGDWALREHGRMKAYMMKQKGAGND